jgi:hypothetical protein
LLSVDAAGCAFCSRELRNLAMVKFVQEILTDGTHSLEFFFVLAVYDNADLGDNRRLANLKLQ